ncbi:chain length determinant protein EpsF [Pelomonas cellulosilytica]|uniref:Chain length determinant protein EpsF n=1 Tax=Pelomonas cellulosilytica TaxID=2906762 RepID=A0ABS8Y5P0_9BURK|nr:chain length determinant protein EpsF [Pelomonas sp. P8]MCE4557835.1 chain length determinant protein EpsF [Pelomonas sp. P8]
MSFSQFLAILRARKKAAFLAFALVVLAALALSLLLPKKYKAEASVVIDAKPDPVSALGSAATGLPNFIATQIDIMTSDRVALRVIRDLKLAEIPVLREQWQEGGGDSTIEQFLIEILQRGLDIKPSRESNVITVTYKSSDPRFSATLANAFVQAYIATTLELRADPAQNFRRFFDVQTKEAREALEKAQAKLSAYQQEKGIIATDERLDVENARLNELSSQLTQLQAISAESSSRQGQAQGARGDQLAEVLNNPLISGLKADLTRGEARLKELTSRFGEAHPQVVEARANAAELRSRIEAETKKVMSGVGVSNTINQGREAQVRTSLEAQRSKLLQLKAVRDEGMLLQREVDNAQRTYDLLTARLNQTALEAQSNQSYATSLTVAQPPSEAASPKLLRNMAAGVFLGIVIAIAVVMTLEKFDRRARSSEDLANALGLPVLGVLPGPNAKRFTPGRLGLSGLPVLTAGKSMQS